MLPEKELHTTSVPVSTFTVSVSDLYIPRPCAIPFLGIFVSNFRYCVFAVKLLTKTPLTMEFLLKYLYSYGYFTICGRPNRLILFKTCDCFNLEKDRTEIDPSTLSFRWDIFQARPLSVSSYRQNVNRPYLSLSLSLAW